MMRVANVVGTRPQLIKAAALQPALRKRHDGLFDFGDDAADLRLSQRLRLLLELGDFCFDG